MTSNNRPSITRIARDLAATQQQVGEAFALHGRLRKEVADHRAGLQRHGNLHRVTDRRLSDQGARILDLQRAIKRIRATQATLGSHATDVQLKNILHELGRINDQARAFVDATNTDIRSLRDEMSVLGHSVAEARDQIDALIAHPNNQYDLARSTVASTATTRSQPNWAAGLIVGAIAGLLMAYGISELGFPKSFKDYQLLASIIVAVAFGGMASGVGEKFTTTIISRLNLAEVPAQPAPPQAPMVPDPNQASGTNPVIAPPLQWGDDITRVTPAVQEPRVRVRVNNGRSA